MPLCLTREKINCPLPFAHINSPIKLRAGWRKRKSHHAQKRKTAKQRSSEHRTLCNIFFPIPFLRLGPNFNWRDHRQPLAVSYAAHLISVQKNSRKMQIILRLFFKKFFLHLRINFITFFPFQHDSAKISIQNHLLIDRLPLFPFHAARVAH